METATAAAPIAPPSAFDVYKSKHELFVKVLTDSHLLCRETPPCAAADTKTLLCDVPCGSFAAVSVGLTNTAYNSISVFVQISNKDAIKADDPTVSFTRTMSVVNHLIGMPPRCTIDGVPSEFYPFFVEPKSTIRRGAQGLVSKLFSQINRRCAHVFGIVGMLRPTPMPDWFELVMPPFVGTALFFNHAHGGVSKVVVRFSPSVLWTKKVLMLTEVAHMYRGERFETVVDQLSTSVLMIDSASALALSLPKRTAPMCGTYHRLIIDTPDASFLCPISDGFSLVPGTTLTPSYFLTRYAVLESIIMGGKYGLLRYTSDNTVGAAETAGLFTFGTQYIPTDMFVVRGKELARSRLYRGIVRTDDVEADEPKLLPKKRPRADDVSEGASALVMLKTPRLSGPQILTPAKLTDDDPIVQRLLDRAADTFAHDEKK